MQRRPNKKSLKRTTRTVRHSKDDTLPETDLKIMLTEANNIFDELIIVLAGYEGMRESEIAHMDEEWVDFQEGVIIIPKEKKCKCGECERLREGTWETKTDAGARKIPIRTEAMDVIRRYFTAHKEIGCSRQTVWNHVKDLARKSKLTKKVYPHSLRATAATLWGQMGLSAPSLCKIMGWTNIETANVYVNADMESAVQEAKMRMRNDR